MLAAQHLLLNPQDFPRLPGQCHLLAAWGKREGPGSRCIGYHSDTKAWETLVRQSQASSLTSGRGSLGFMFTRAPAGVVPGGFEIRYHLRDKVIATSTNPCVWGDVWRLWIESPSVGWGERGSGLRFVAVSHLLHG